MDRNTFRVRRSSPAGRGQLNRLVVAALASAIVVVAVVALSPTAEGRADGVQLPATSQEVVDAPAAVELPAKPVVAATDVPIEPADIVLSEPAVGVVVDAPRATRPECAGGYSAEELNAELHVGAAGGVVGADYARSQVLPDGRVLWVFQDVFIGGTGTLGSASFSHNAGLVQDGTCFEVLQGKRGHSWIGGDVEHELHHWFWPLDSVIDANGLLAQFVVEFRNPNGTGAFAGAEPVAVWVASIDLDTFEVVDLRPAPDFGDRPLYGFSIASDDTYHYLYGNCYRQFADPGFAGFLHDTDCGPLTYVARVPVGHPEASPEYWSGTGWSSVRADAAPVSQKGTFANPVQVRRLGDLYVSVTKVDDWWEDSVVVEVATSAEGPFVELRTIDVLPVCDVCNTYFAQPLPWTGADGSLLIAISNNAWNMGRDAYPHPERYRPSVLSIPLTLEVENSGGGRVESR